MALGGAGFAARGLGGLGLARAGGGSWKSGPGETTSDGPAVVKGCPDAISGSWGGAGAGVGGGSAAIVEGGMTCSSGRASHQLTAMTATTAPAMAAKKIFG